jgi:3-hydroxyisobutyrate dehydrogenase-like beta-hydroxyacid dehydrogenase
MVGCPADRTAGQRAKGKPTTEFENTIKPILSTMGLPERIFYCGENGAGSIAKVCNNMALAIQMISVAKVGLCQATI